ncbi:hypothetical protein [Aerosakkonema funiforme]|uniref:hypothetical protein n=1 Tax=Aerosakkonema funiforme TaxID=1246630 RepID=UPI0016891B7C|nr:hypothetical protein [Aerosakkonema funiforme]
MRSLRIAVGYCFFRIQLPNTDRCLAWANRLGVFLLGRETGFLRRSFTVKPTIFRRNPVSLYGKVEVAIAEHSRT